MARAWILIVLVASACGDDSTSDAAMTDGGDDGSVDASLDASVDSAVDASEPDAGTACDEEGAMRLGTCGNCGMAQEVCEGGFWIAGTCLGEGECAPGALETESLPMCGERARLCSSTCGWLDWDTTAEPGDCEPGAEREVDGSCSRGEQQPQTCSDACAWEDMGPCVSGCAGTRRTSPADAEEMCIPAGDFIRGDDTFADAPVTTVTLSAYYIDRYPVTVRRFMECRAAGACSATFPDVFEDFYATDPTTLDSPIREINFDEAVEFCEWDGRRLPTEAEYEKAARGPAPRDIPWVWDDGLYDCEALPVFMCPSYVMTPTFEPVTAWPDSASYYGVELLLGGYVHWMSDWYGASYFTDPSSLVDPQGPPSGTYRVQKGSRRSTTPSTIRLSMRRFNLPGSSIRCARSEE